MTKMINNELDFTLNNGEKVKLTLNFKLLLKLRSNYPEEYNEFNKVVLGKSKEDRDFFEILSVVYAAYLCANFDNKDRYTKEEFRDLMPLSITQITNVQNKLLGIEKN